LRRRIVLRLATVSDIPAIQRVRASVRENRLVSTIITDQDVEDALLRRGRGWVIESDGHVVAFAIADATSGNVWALFVEPEHEGRGYGRRLLSTMVDWLWLRGLQCLWLTTGAGTRAQRFYEAAGWVQSGVTPDGELRYELSRPDEG
jgi:GNAT superfamily N-acetyltransferase